MSRKPNTSSPTDRWWMRTGRGNGWQMPRTHWLKRLPIIRHLRSWKMNVAIHFKMRPYHHGHWIAYGVRRGFERPLKG